MPIGTSDGEYFENEVHMQHASFAERAVNVYRPSDNVEDARPPNVIWGGSFGPQEGGPPVGIDADVWYPYVHSKEPFGKMAAADSLYNSIKDSDIVNPILKEQVYRDTSSKMGLEMLKEMLDTDLKKHQRLPPVESDSPTQEKPTLPWPAPVDK